MSAPERINRSTLRTIKILDYVATVGVAVGISELSAALSIPKSSVSNIVYALVEGRYLEIEDDERRTFRLGFNLFQAGISYLAHAELHQVAHPVLHALMQRTGETVHVATEDGGHLVFLDSIEAEDSLIRSAARLGRSDAPMYRSGLGKALLAAHRDEELIAMYRGAGFEPATTYTISNLQQLIAEMRETRRRGYAIDNREGSEDLFCVAAPVCDRSGGVVAAISCSVPYHKIDRSGDRSGDRVDEIADAVSDAAGSISQRLGFLGIRPYGNLM